MLPALVHRCPKSTSAHADDAASAQSGLEYATALGRHVRTVLRSVVVERAMAWSETRANADGGVPSDSQKKP
jgi:hypothetical protein